ncbi:MAG TPA: FMN-binding negative transcriptional regulator [Edaphobacter sp.]|nr:FMN-binding negative transcriptional regulator [Edaphobacter sp.]
MYIPKHNEETRTEVLDHLMRTRPLASLVTLGATGLFATHLPLVLHRKDDQHAVLRGHLARANRQWKDFSRETDALAIFSGPQHYITPAWYPDKAETGKVVPTWNYAVVHAYGRLEIIEDSDWLLTHLNSLTDIHEATRPEPWSVADAPADFIATIARGIVGIEMKIERLEGKWKASQNQTEQTRASVAEGLEALGTEDALAMSELVKGRRL